MSNVLEAQGDFTYVEEGRSTVGERLVELVRLESLNGSCCKREGVLRRLELPLCPKSVDHLKGRVSTAKPNQGLNELTA